MAEEQKIDLIQESKDETKKDLAQKVQELRAQAQVLEKKTEDLMNVQMNQILLIAALKDCKAKIKAADSSLINNPNEDVMNLAYRKQTNSSKKNKRDSLPLLKLTLIKNLVISTDTKKEQQHIKPMGASKKFIPFVSINFPNELFKKEIEKILSMEIDHKEKMRILCKMVPKNSR